MVYRTLGFGGDPRERDELAAVQAVRGRDALDAVRAGVHSALAVALLRRPQQLCGTCPVQTSRTKSCIRCAVHVKGIETVACFRTFQLRDGGVDGGVRLPVRGDARHGGVRPLRRLLRRCRRRCTSGWRAQLQPPRCSSSTLSEVPFSGVAATARRPLRCRLRRPLRCPLRRCPRRPLRRPLRVVRCVVRCVSSAASSAAPSAQTSRQNVQ